MMLSSVDLPQPDGPTMQRNSEASMSKLTSLTPGTLPPGRIVDQRYVADFDMHQGPSGRRRRRYYNFAFGEKRDSGRDTGL